MPLFEEFLRSETEHADAAWARLLTMKVGWGVDAQEVGGGVSRTAIWSAS